MTDDTVTACPKCDSVKIETRQPSTPVSNAAIEHEWRCADCGRSFDDPRERPPQNEAWAASRSGLARELAEADSLEEVVGDD